MFRILSDVTSSGNVVFKIKANGDVFTDGATTIGSPADLAENYPTNEPLPAGTVVAFSTTTEEWNLNNSEDSSQAFQMSTVRKARKGDEALGVISTRPGILLGGNTKNGTPVAFSGRVPVLVTNENGVVMQGDYLTISTSTEGYAMKATDSGYSIGRAISDASSTLATTSVLMVVENRHRSLTLSSIEGLSVLASSSEVFARPARSMYDTLVDKIVHGNTVVTEYFALSMKAVSGYFDKLFAKEIYTDKVCIKKSNGVDVCLDGDQVESMLNSTNIPLMTPPPIGGGDAQGGGGTTIPPTDASSTPPIGGEVVPPVEGTSTPPVEGGSTSTNTPAGTEPPVLDPSPLPVEPVETPAP